MTDVETVIRLENASVSIGDKVLVKNVNFTVNRNDRVCVVGASGSGKTTLVRIITGLQKVTQGTAQIADVRTAVVFQEDRLLTHRSALGNLKAVGVDKEKAEKYLRAVGLEQDMKKRPYQMSGGMKRRLALARALAFGGELYVLDEPLTGLDRETAEKMLRLIKEETEGKTLVMITHDDFSAGMLGAKTVNINARGGAKE